MEDVMKEALTSDTQLELSESSQEIKKVTFFFNDASKNQPMVQIQTQMMSNLNQN